MRKSKHLSLDFDGVIHRYSRGWQKGAIYDEPTPGTGVALLNYLSFYRVSIYSSRSKSIRMRMAMKRYVLDIIKDVCFSHTDLADATWAVTNGKPAGWRPWTAIGDVQDQAREMYTSASEWPWFKPAAFISIDDRALTFTGRWDDFSVDKLVVFKPWNVGH